MSVEELVHDAQEQQVTIIPMIVPIPIFKFLNDIAVKEGKTVSRLVTEILREGIAALEKKHGG